jgi:DNA-binding transcriptional ArsR family regulator
VEYKQEKYALLIFKTLANIHRIRTIKILNENAKTPLSVNQLCGFLKMDQGKLSNHLVRMRKDGILKAKQDKTNMLYTIKDPQVAMVLTQIL